jgi:hypothetical protein
MVEHWSVEAEDAVAGDKAGRGLSAMFVGYRCVQ